MCILVVTRFHFRTPMSYNRKYNVLSALINKTFLPSFQKIKAWDVAYYTAVGRQER